MRTCKRFLLWGALVSGGLILSGCRTVEEGTVIGAASGAVLGGVIGNNMHAHNAPVGAAIGAVVGGVLGNQMGRQQEQINQAQQQNAVLQAQVAQQAEAARTQTVWVRNSNGSRTPVRLTQASGGQWVGPKGEYYASMPSPEQLHSLYGF
ncbi:MAG: hypothetical protein A3K19_20880 [Lentisphaerae bacterium RIFOXYB12_FULL_65_16]|nr:MAG: hypothetical protein A3K18_19305 [Lentisphaerae bacterium RIFOXYA12_64_32]OGV85190.1 MAG: hypothetical protein A3K19_20880 [Lentisphaerae bacterium RIFOXYB12_FULL_65_16]